MSEISQIWVCETCHIYAFSQLNHFRRSPGFPGLPLSPGSPFGPCHPDLPTEPGSPGSPGFPLDA